MFRFVFLFSLGLISWQCSNSSSNTQQSDAGSPPPEEPAAATPVRYPSLPVATLEMLWEKCDYIDYIFYGKSFSMNQSNKAAIQGALRHVSDEVPEINPSCQPIGHIFYQVDGENALEADLYFQPQCLYFVFYDNGQPAYANKMTKQGLNFFQQIFQSQEGRTPAQ